MQQINTEGEKNSPIGEGRRMAGDGALHPWRPDDDAAATPKILAMQEELNLGLRSSSIVGVQSSLSSLTKEQKLRLLNR